MLWIVDDCVSNCAGSVEHHFEWKGSIGENEYRDFRQAIAFIETFYDIREMLLIAKKNGDDLYDYLQPKAMNNRYLVNKVHPKEIERQANRLAFNFAASFKTAVEIVERVAKAWKNENSLTLLRESESLLFDSEFAYRFWVRLRNYIVHNRTIYSGLVCDGVKTLITADYERIISWQGWNRQLKLEIKKRGRETDYSDTIADAENSLMALCYAYIIIFHDKYDISRTTIESYRHKFNIKGEFYFSRSRDLEGGYFDIALHVPCWEFENIVSVKRFVLKNNLDRLVLPSVTHH